MLYILPIAILLLSYAYSKFENETNKKYLWVFGCVLVWLVLALRSSSVGSDTVQYLRYFERFRNLSWEEAIGSVQKDYGFYVFTKILSDLSSWNVFYIGVTAFASCIGVFVFLYDNTRRPLLALFFYITIANFLFLFTGIRQSIAMSICLLAVRSAKEKKLLSYLLIVGIAALFHHSALLFLPTYFVLNRRFSWGLVVLEVIVTIVAAMFYEQLLQQLNDALDYEYTVETVTNGGIFYAVLLLILVLAVMGRKLWREYETDNVMINMGFVSAMVWTFRLFSRVAERPSLYWLTAFPVVLSNELDYYERKTRGLLVGGAVVLCYLLYIRRLDTLAYQFFWQ